jgi:hypothetical protein
MITLFFVILILIGVVSMILLEKGEAERARILCLIGLFVLWFSMVFVIGKMAEKKAYTNSLDGNNPYSKEYIYKQQDSTYVVVDSIYVKEETKN